MIVPLEKKPSIRIAGYLEKRGKMRLLVCRWKRWWFVLEGRLLLYYKSQLEYLNLSPCRGSLNLGLVSSVRPGKGLELSVVTRSQTVVLISKPRPSIQCEARQGPGAECRYQVTDCCTGMYMNMSLCRRSLNLGLVSSVRPGKCLGLELSHQVSDCCTGRYI
ncbi:uncharacterized protein LOC128995342 [Macrosteles quadrilineatus]|uniref:uncharacterized protein LOC128995342 n=1 Tax=Macrosteles quadrilineatus TaxID=74068 RepID=UPI0023E0EA61|nr:uncharacterized protein LOC128995342 [Macrosteles quadrilineatus]